MLGITGSQLQSFPSTLVQLVLFIPLLCVCLLTGVCQSQTTMQDTIRKLYMYVVEIKTKGSEMGHRKKKPDHAAVLSAFARCVICLFARFANTKALQPCEKQSRTTLQVWSWEHNDHKDTGKNHKVAQWPQRQMAWSDTCLWAPVEEGCAGALTCPGAHHLTTHPCTGGDLNLKLSLLIRMFCNGKVILWSYLFHNFPPLADRLLHGSTV